MMAKGRAGQWLTGRRGEGQGRAVANRTQGLTGRRGEGQGGAVANRTQWLTGRRAVANRTQGSG